MIIKDHILKPYFLTVDENNYTVCTESLVTKPSSKDFGKYRRKDHGYFNTDVGALSKILELKRVKGGELTT